MSISFFSKFGWWNVPTWRSQVPAELSAVNCLLRIIFKYKVDLPFSDKLLEESSNSSLSSEWAPPYVWQVATWVLQTTWVLSPSRRIPYVSSQEIMNSLYRQCDFTSDSHRGQRKQMVIAWFTAGIFILFIFSDRGAKGWSSKQFWFFSINIWRTHFISFLRSGKARVLFIQITNNYQAIFVSAVLIGNIIYLGFWR